MLLIHTQKVTPRLDYAFKHICTRILGVKVSFSSSIEAFIAHQGPKISYGKKPMGNELFVHSHGLLTEQGFEDIDVSVNEWEDTICFFPMSDVSAIPFDIFAASFYLLSRYEEYLPHVKDGLGRFTATESLAFSSKFLRQPVVDLWAYKFKKVLLDFFPEMSFDKNSYTVHHVVTASRPFEFSQRGLFRNVTGILRDLFNLKIKRIYDRSRVLLKLRKDPLDTFTWIVNSAKHTTSKLSVFFLLGEAMTFREDLNTKREKFQTLIKYVADYYEVGLIFSYHSLQKYEALKVEKKQLEELTHRPLLSAINDQLIVNLPHNYRDLLELEVARDFTMIYDDVIGFRAGTCTPFLFYDLDYEIKTPLVIHPMAATTAVLRKHKDAETILQEMTKMVKSVNGTFSLLFTNRDFISNRDNRLWRSFFQEN